MIITHLDGSTLWEGAADSLADAVRQALAAGLSLAGADLTDADLRAADLRAADLADADLRGAILADADLRGADLAGADLTEADLRAADLRGANLTSYRDDVWAVLRAAPTEADAVLRALREGRVDGCRPTRATARAWLGRSRARGAVRTTRSLISARTRTGRRKSGLPVFGRAIRPRRTSTRDTRRSGWRRGSRPCAPTSSPTRERCRTDRHAVPALLPRLDRPERADDSARAVLARHRPEAPRDEARHHL